MADIKNDEINVLCDKDISTEDKAAIAVAIHLFQEEGHDKESGIITIKHTPSAWTFALNPRL